MTTPALLDVLIAGAASALVVGVVAAAQTERPRLATFFGTTLGALVIGFCAGSIWS